MNPSKKYHWFKMAMTQGIARSSIVIGIIELVLGSISVICGIVSMSKLTSPAATTLGIWALYVSIHRHVVIRL